MAGQGTAVVYGRFSEAEKDGKVVTLASQLRNEGERARRHGYEVVAEFADDGISGWKKNVTRPDWEAMLAYVVEHNVDRIYTRETDRTTRQILQTAALLDFCERHGVTLVEGGNVVEPDDENAKDMRMFKAMTDKNYSTTISKNTKRARREGALKGRPHPGPRPFGYEDDRKTLRPEEAEPYRELFRRVIDGEGLVRIGKDWERRGILNRKGARFSADSLANLIRAPRAVGYVQHDGEVLIGDDGSPVIGEWEPIVDVETQLAACAAIAGRNRNLRTADNTERAPRLLSSMIVCGECDRPMRVRYNAHPVNPAQYLCDVAKSQCCGKCCAKAEAVEQEVEARFLWLLKQPSTLATIEEMHAEREDVTALLDAVKRFRAELLDLSRQKAEGELEAAEYRLQREITLRRRDEAEDRLARATDVPALLTMDPAQILADWAEGDLDWKRHVLSAFVVSVNVKRHDGPSRKGHFDGNRVVVHWKV
jgi:DNA invertase Pin-like site-specific DNA recombinase